MYEYLILCQSQHQQTPVPKALDDNISKNVKSQIYVYLNSVLNIPIFNRNSPFGVLNLQYHTHKIHS